MHAAAVCAIALALALKPGDRIVERATMDDRVAWVLPPDRLASMERSGFVIDEDTRTSAITHATVDPDDHKLITLHGEVSTTVTDVPRHRVKRSEVALNTTLSARNESVPAQRIDLESAPMADLPEGPACAGATWVTRMPVTTTLGSGLVSIEHTVTRADAHGVIVRVSGSGVISGMEYNLPRLLPGAMSITGTARFDPAIGDVVQEDYVVKNRLIRTVKAKTIGFLETETVHVVTAVSKSPADRRTPPRTSGTRGRRTPSHRIAFRPHTASSTR